LWLLVAVVVVVVWWVNLFCEFADSLSLSLY
jgi:hypothetical protein